MNRFYLYRLYRQVSIFIAVSLCIISVYSQQKNDLLDRNFWKEKPTLNIIKQKIEQGHSPTDFDANQFDATTLAINTNASNDIILHLLSIQENHPNKLTHDGRTYMFWATWKGNIEIMKYLVANKTNLKHIDEHGASIAVFAASVGQKDPLIYNYLEKNGTNIISEKDKNGANILLLVAPFLNSMEETTYFTKKGLSLQSTDDKGYNIFAYASKHGNISFLQDLIRAGIDAKAITKDGGNAFIYATRPTRFHTNNLTFYYYLEEKAGVSPNISTNAGVNPLHNLSRSKDKDIIEYFIKKGVNVNQVNSDGNTPLMLAARYQQDVSIFNLFFERAKNINTQNKLGQSALTNALMNQSDHAVKISLLLIGGGASQGIKDVDGNNMSYYLISHYKNIKDYQEKLRMLYTFGFSNNKIQANNNTLFHVAVHFKNKEVVQYLFDTEKENININAYNKDFLTPLHLAATSDQDGVMLQLLVKLGADIHKKTEYGESAYELAIENEMLKKNNVDLNFLKTTD